MTADKARAQTVINSFLTRLMLCSSVLLRPDSAGLFAFLLLFGSYLACWYSYLACWRSAMRFCRSSFQSLPFAGSRD